MILVDTLIIGAGITGLSTAWHLRDSDLKIAVLEGSSELFGHSKSHSHQSLFWEEGPHVSFTKNKYVYDFISNHCMSTRLIKPKVASFFEGGWLSHPIQHNLQELPTPLRLQIERELDELIGSGEALGFGGGSTYEDWILKRFGKTLYETFFKPYTLKYWQAHPSELTHSWVGERIANPKSRNKGEFFTKKPHYIQEIRYPEGAGFQALYESLADGYEVNLETSVVHVDLEAKIVVDNRGETWSYSTLVNTTPLPAFIQMLPKHQRPNIDGLEWTSIELRNHTLDKEPLVDFHWGYVYSPQISFSRFWQPHLLAGLGNGRYGIQTETYSRSKARQYLNEPRPSAVDNYSMFETSDSKLDSEIRDIRLISDETTVSTSKKRIEWGNVIFTTETSETLNKIWETLSNFGLRRESGDTHPLAKWLDDGRPDSGNNLLGDLIMAGRYAQWKYFWSDDCLLRGKEVADAIISRSE